jgi:hypothetical protein
MDASCSFRFDFPDGLHRRWYFDAMIAGERPATDWKTA